MKKNIIIALLLCGAIGTTWLFASKVDIKAEIIHCFETGDADKLLSYCSDKVILMSFDEQEYEHKKEVREQMLLFFKKYPPKSFKVRHYGKSTRENYFYMIGIFQATEEVFRVNLMIDNDQIEDINISFEDPFSFN